MADVFGEYVGNGRIGGGGGSGFANPATTNLSMGSYNVTSSGGNGVWTLSPLGGGQDDGPQISAAMYAAKLAGGGKVQLLPGQFSIKTDIKPTGWDYACDVHLIGTPETVLSIDADLTLACLDLRGETTTNAEPISNITAGDTSITVTTAANAGPIKAGDVLAIKGTDSDSNADIEIYHLVSVNGNAGSGVVALANSILKTMTSCQILYDFGGEASSRGGMDNSVEDLIIEMSATPSTNAVNGIAATFQRNFILKNIKFIGFDKNPATPTLSSPVNLSKCLLPKIENITIERSKQNGIILSDVFGGYTHGCSIVDSRQTGAIQCSRTMEHTIEDCNIVGAVKGINFSGSNLARRNIIRGNYVSGCSSEGISDVGTTAAMETLIVENEIECCASNGGVYLFQNRASIINNRIRLCNIGIYRTGGGNKSIIDGNDVQSATSFGIVVDTASSYHEIGNNNIQGGGGGDSAILLIASNSKIQGNVISTRTGKGIEFSSADNNLMDGNQISGTSAAGILLDANSDNNLVCNNSLVGLTLTQGAGSNNTFTNNKTT